MVTETDLVELKQLCSDAREITEFGKKYILLSQFRLPNGCAPAVVDTLLSLDARDGYANRLYFAQQISCRNGLNWNTRSVPILQRSWFAYSWRVSASTRPIEILAQHLKALQ